LRTLAVRRCPFNVEQIVGDLKDQAETVAN